MEVHCGDTSVICKERFLLRVFFFASLIRSRSVGFANFSRSDWTDFGRDIANARSRFSRKDGSAHKAFIATESCWVWVQPVAKLFSRDDFLSAVSDRIRAFIAAIVLDRYSGDCHRFRLASPIS